MDIQYAEEPGIQINLTSELGFGRDQEILGQLFSRYANQLYRTAFCVLGSREDAEDAVQDGLLSAVRHLKSFEGRSLVSTWLTRIVFNASLMRLRKIRAHSVISIDWGGPDEPGISPAARIADPRPGPEEAYALQEQAALVRQCMETLPPARRSAFWLRDIEGMTTQQAAEALRVSEGALKTRLHRARLELSRRLGDVPRPHTHKTSNKLEKRPGSAGVTR